MTLHFNQHSLAGLHNRPMNCDENLSHISPGLEDREKKTIIKEKTICNLVYESDINSKVVRFSPTLYSIR